jgi:hypothetical protein
MAMDILAIYEKFRKVPYLLAAAGSDGGVCPGCTARRGQSGILSTGTGSDVGADRAVSGLLVIADSDGSDLSVGGRPGRALVKR